MTDTQVMAALEPTQADINAANSFFNRMDNPIRHALLVQAFARHRIASSSPAEPVAWRRMNPQGTASTGVTDTEYYRDLWIREGSDVRPLYATPLPPPAVDALEKVKLVNSWLCTVAQLDMDEIVADGGITAAMVVRQEADHQQKRLRSAIDDLIAIPADDADEAYEIGKRDGYEAAIADVDRRTGGDGEYFASTIPGRGCPDWQTMMANIVERFESSIPVAADAEVRKALKAIQCLKRSIMIDVGSCHANRGPGASSAMREDDRDMRRDIEEAFALIDAALATPPSVPAQQGEDDWGCEYCRNDGCLNENNCCPKCDAQYEEDAATPPSQDQKGVEEQ